MSDYAPYTRYARPLADAIARQEDDIRYRIAAAIEQANREGVTLAETARALKISRRDVRAYLQAHPDDMSEETRRRRESVRERVERGDTVSEIADALNVSRETVYNDARETRLDIVSNRPPRLSLAERAERDARVVALRESGVEIEAIAETCETSTRNVSRILRNHDLTRASALSEIVVADILRMYREGASHTSIAAIHDIRRETVGKYIRAARQRGEVT